MIASTAFCLCIMKEPQSPNVSFHNGYTTLPTTESAAQLENDAMDEENNFGFRRN